MNPIIVTIVIATVTFILSIFGALQFYSSRMEKYIDAKVEGLRAEIAATRSELKGETSSLRAELKGEISSLRVEQAATREKVERIERQLEALFVPKPR